MKKRYLVVMLAILAVLLCACGKDHQEDTSAPTHMLQETTAPVENTDKVNIPGLEDSIFDDVATEATSTETGSTTEGNTDNSTSGGNGSGFVSPDASGSTPQDSHNQETTGPVTEPGTEPLEPGMKPQVPETEPQEPGTGSQQPETEPQEPGTTPPNANRSEYEKFQNLSPAEQQEYMNSFENIDAFFNWYNAAKDEHEQLFPDIEIGGDGSVDMGDIIGGNS